MTERITFNTLIELSKTSNYSFSLEKVNDDSLKFTNHYHPWSIRETEAEILYNLIVQNNLQRGFEICTGVGISSLITGHAFSKTGGKLITIDAYVEEAFNLSTSYDINTKIVKKPDAADGYLMTNYLISKLEIQNNVVLDIGWSPDDVPSIYKKHYSDHKIDYAFIDGGHSVKQIDEDVRVLLPYLSDNSVIVFHDFLCVGNDTIDLVNKQCGFNNFKDYQTLYQLAAFSRGNIIL